MKTWDSIRFCTGSLSGYPLRTSLMLLAMAIGVAAVVMLTSLGEGARLYVTQQFSSLGSHLLIVLPGRSETVGGPPPLIGETPRDLTLEDALALQRSSAVDLIAPIMVGSAPVAHGNLTRETVVLGSTAELLPVRNLVVAQRRFLPEGDIDRAEAFCVLVKRSFWPVWAGWPVWRSVPAALGCWERWCRACPPTRHGAMCSMQNCCLPRSACWPASCRLGMRHRWTPSRRYGQNRPALTG